MSAPAFVHAPPRVRSLLDPVAKLAAALGRPLDDAQRVAVETLTGYREDGRPSSLEAGVVCPRQNMKALDCSTPMLTTRGWSTMGELRPGDEVFHPSGYPVRILRCSDVMVGNACFEVSTSDGRRIVADGDHLWTVIDKRRQRDGRFVERSLTTSELLAEGLLRSARSNGRNEYRFALPEQRPIKSPDVELPIDPYLLGMWLGDGCSSAAEITCGLEDLEHVKAQIMAAGASVVSCRANQSSAAIQVRFRLAAAMRDGFESRARRMGIWRNKHVPEAYLAAGTMQREALLQGLMDTDGTIGRARGQATFCSTRRELAEGALYLARSLGWRATMRKKPIKFNGQPHGVAWDVHFTPKRTDPFAPFRLARKAAIVGEEDGGAGRHTVSIASITPVETRPVRCITVDSPDGLYLAGRDLLVTHNTWILQLIVLARLLEPGGDRFIVWSAHLFDTAQETFQDFLVLIDSHPWLSDLVERVDRGNGEEQVTFAGRRRLRFRARAKTGGRGLSGDCVVLDEAFALRPAHMGALLPILSTRKRALVLYGSSAGLADSAVLRGVRDRGRAGRAGAPAYVEWCAPGSWSEPGCAAPECRHLPETPGCVMDDESLWLLANPAAQVDRIGMDYLRAERVALTPEEFGRERLGWWDESPDEALDLNAWGALADAGSVPEPRPVGLGWAVSPGQRSAAVVLVGRRADGLLHVELTEFRPGTSWLGGSLQELSGRLGVEAWHRGGRTPEATALAGLPDGLRVSAMKAGDWPAACGSLGEVVDAGSLRHLGDPRWAAALAAVVRRDVGDGAWEMAWRGSQGDAAPVMALVAALHGLAVNPSYDINDSIF